MTTYSMNVETTLGTSLTPDADPWKSHRGNTGKESQSYPSLTKAEFCEDSKLVFSKKYAFDVDATPQKAIVLGSDEELTSIQEHPSLYPLDKVAVSCEALNRLALKQDTGNRSYPDVTSISSMNMHPAVQTRYHLHTSMRSLGLAQSVKSLNDECPVEDYTRSLESLLPHQKPNKEFYKFIKSIAQERAEEKVSAETRRDTNLEVNERNVVCGPECKASDTKYADKQASHMFDRVMNESNINDEETNACYHSAITSPPRPTAFWVELPDEPKVEAVPTCSPCARQNQNNYWLSMADEQQEVTTSPPRSAIVYSPVASAHTDIPIIRTKTRTLNRCDGNMNGIGTPVDKNELPTEHIQSIGNNNMQTAQEVIPLKNNLMSSMSAKTNDAGSCPNTSERKIFAKQQDYEGAGMAGGIDSFELKSSRMSKVQKTYVTLNKSYTITKCPEADVRSFETTTNREPNQSRESGGDNDRYKRLDTEKTGMFTFVHDYELEQAKEIVDESLVQASQLSCVPDQEHKMDNVNEALYQCATPTDKELLGKARFRMQENADNGSMDAIDDCEYKQVEVKTPHDNQGGARNECRDDGNNGGHIDKNLQIIDECISFHSDFSGCLDCFRKPNEIDEIKPKKSRRKPKTTVETSTRKYVGSKTSAINESATIAVVAPARENDVCGDEEDDDDNDDDDDANMESLAQCPEIPFDDDLKDDDVTFAEDFRDILWEGAPEEENRAIEIPPCRNQAHPSLPHVISNDREHSDLIHTASTEAKTDSDMFDKEELALALAQVLTMQDESLEKETESFTQIIAELGDQSKLRSIPSAYAKAEANDPAGGNPPLSYHLEQELGELPKGIPIRVTCLGTEIVDSEKERPAFSTKQMIVNNQNIAHTKGGLPNAPFYAKEDIEQHHEGKGTLKAHADHSRMINQPTTHAQPGHEQGIVIPPAPIHTEHAGMSTQMIEHSPSVKIEHKVHPNEMVITPPAQAKTNNEASEYLPEPRVKEKIIQGADEWKRDLKRLVNILRNNFSCCEISNFLNTGFNFSIIKKEYPPLADLLEKLRSRKMMEYSEIKEEIKKLLDYDNNRFEKELQQLYVDIMDMKVRFAQATRKHDVACPTTTPCVTQKMYSTRHKPARTIPGAVNFTKNRKNKPGKLKSNYRQDLTGTEHCVSALCYGNTERLSQAKEESSKGLSIEHVFYDHFELKDAHRRKCDALDRGPGAFYSPPDKFAGQKEVTNRPKSAVIYASAKDTGEVMKRLVKKVNVGVSISGSSGAKDENPANDKRKDRPRVKSCDSKSYGRLQHVKTVKNDQKIPSSNQVVDVNKVSSGRSQTGIPKKSVELKMATEDTGCVLEVKAAYQGKAKGNNDEVKKTASLGGSSDWRPDDKDWIHQLRRSKSLSQGLYKKEEEGEDMFWNFNHEIRASNSHLSALKWPSIHRTTALVDLPDALLSPFADGSLFDLKPTAYYY